MTRCQRDVDEMSGRIATFANTLVGPSGRYVGTNDYAIVVCALWLHFGLCILLSIYFDDTIHTLMVH